MLFGKIIAVYFENQTEPRNTLRGRKADLLNDKVGAHCALKS
jgi:hypothetical protein